VTDSRGKLVVISGPSGAGKTSVCRELKKDPRVTFSISATTRPRRNAEEDGRDYHFLGEEDFLARRAAGEFLESARYNDHYYGTLRAPMVEALAAGQNFVVEIEVQGTRQLRENGVQGIYIFVVPPSLEELQRRLEKRGTESAAQIQERMRIAAEELEAGELYDHEVVNEDLQETIREVKGLIGLS
jgi:guanylate kinase